MRDDGNVRLGVNLCRSPRSVPSKIKGLLSPAHGQPPQDSRMMRSVGKRSVWPRSGSSMARDMSSLPAAAVSCFIVLRDGELSRLSSMSS